MMKCFALCMLALTTLWPDAHGYLGDDMAKTIQLCCNEGYEFARNHTMEECQNTQPVSPEIAPAFMSMCTMAKGQCCREFFQKKTDCANGVEVAQTKNNSCGSLKGSGQVCCVDCERGAALGRSKGASACAKSYGWGSSTEETLAFEAFSKCCQKGAKEWKDNSSSRSSNSISSSSMRSTCEDYAPQELCAHHCIAIPGSYRCECRPGFMLMADGRNCMKVTKNRCKPRNHCQHKCNDNGVEVKCSCRRGYELMSDGKSCRDIDECQLDMTVCLPGTRCHNIQGSYRCLPVKNETGTCPPGFTRNLVNNVCDDINECLSPKPPCPSYLCKNTVGGYLCNGVPGDPDYLNRTPPPVHADNCPIGFKFAANGECEDEDECEAKKDDCNPLSQYCINTHSSFFCQDKASRHCPPGFKINSATNKCEDINECEEEGDICRRDQVCINQLGQYLCKNTVDPSSTACPSGMRRKPGSPYCEDIDECAEGIHMCDLNQHCLNTNGSYDCHCTLGYELDITTGACVDVNECATGQHDCYPSQQRCDNTVGSYICVRIAPCGTGYVLQHATGKCEDIDECALGVHHCGPEHSCINLRGSFRCVRRRTTTSTTTPEPIYEEYEYYDEDEIVNTTSSSNETPKEPSTTTTSAPVKLEPPTTKPVTVLPPPDIEKRPEENSVVASAPDHPLSVLPKSSPPAEPVEPEPQPAVTVPQRVPTQPQPVPTQPQPIPTQPQPEPTESQPLPTEPQPIPTEPQPIPTESQPIHTEPQPRSSELPPEPTEPAVKPTEWVPYHRPDSGPTSPPTPVYIPPEIPEEELPKDPREYTTTSSNKPETNNESIPPEPEQPEISYTTLPQSFDKQSPQNPIFVNVDVGKETATIAGEKKDDGSVVIDTNNIPENKWTKVTTKTKECPIGFEPDEYGSCFDVDECATNQHSCSGLTEVCKNSIGGYMCNCAPGFRRDLNTKACDVITTSSTTSTSKRPPPLPTSTIRNLFWGYPEYPVTTRPFRPRNLCDVGFHYNPKTLKCEDINECTNGQANCAAVEICINTEGGYKCDCPPNWKLDEIRHRCVPNNRYGQHIPPGYENEPDATLPPNVNILPPTRTTYMDPEVTHIEDRGTIFRCPAGYRLGEENTCVDVNECVTGEAKCGPLQSCYNLPGGYLCNCPSGYRLIGDHQCEDIDECAMSGKMSICSQNADCVNTMGSYQCKCHVGFRSAPVNDKVCVDVDECMTSRPGSLCQHRCNNVWGGYRCSCHRGYRLNADNSTCSDVDECKEFKDKVPCVGRCLNEPGSYRCACPKGYKLSEDKRSCIDIDECETGEAPCANGGISATSNDVCVNTRGSYRCHRISCPIGYRLENKHRCTKVERICLPGDWNCTRQPTTISYNFITFVSNLYIPDAELKLFTMKGPAWSNAKMRFELRLVDVNAPPSVKKKADIKDFLLTQKTNFEGLMSLVRPLEGPQSIELEMSMDVYTDEHFGGTAVAKLFIYVSEFEF